MRARQIAVFIATVLALSAVTAHAHSVSNAYLTLNVAPGSQQIKGQWDVGLRDLQFVLGIDDNGDGNITWGELHQHQPQIAQYAYAHLKFSSGGKSCQIKPTQQLVDHHADGGYAVLNFTIDCGMQLPTKLSMHYSLLFDIDPSHRGIFVMNDAGATSTALLSPDNATVNLKLSPVPAH